MSFFKIRSFCAGSRLSVSFCGSPSTFYLKKKLPKGFHLIRLLPQGTIYCFKKSPFFQSIQKRMEQKYRKEAAVLFKDKLRCLYIITQYTVNIFITFSMYSIHPNMKQFLCKVLDLKVK